jgi:hypothetical protein
MPNVYEKVVLSEGGFTVELSNQGKKPKFNPNLQNLEKKEVDCLGPGCHNRTKNMDAICTECRKKAKGKNRVRVIHTVDWFGRIIPPGYTRKQCFLDVLPHSQMSESLIEWIGSDKERGKAIDYFVDCVLDEIVSVIPDASSLQLIFERKKEGFSPGGFVALVKKIVDAHFPKSKYSKEYVTLKKFKGKQLDKVPIRVLAAALVIGVGCEESNRGDAWFSKKHGLESTYANAYMPLAYYILRRHTKANPNQAKMCIRG